MKKSMLIIIFLLLIIPYLYASPGGDTEITYYNVLGNDIIASFEDGETKYHHRDRLGTNVLLINQSGELTSEIKTLPFGQEIENTEDTRFTFTGKELDPSGLYYFNARYYNPDLGRFLETDPIMDNHPYGYANNNPLMFVDPTGMEIAATHSTKKKIMPYINFMARHSKAIRQIKEAEYYHFFQFASEGSYEYKKLKEKRHSAYTDIKAPKAAFSYDPTIPRTSYEEIEILLNSPPIDFYEYSGFWTGTTLLPELSKSSPILFHTLAHESLHIYTGILSLKMFGNLGMINSIRKWHPALDELKIEYMIYNMFDLWKDYDIEKWGEMFNKEEYLELQRITNKAIVHYKEQFLEDSMDLEFDERIIERLRVDFYP